MRPTIQTASRIPARVISTADIRVIDLIMLFSCGIIAASLTLFITPSLRIPGSAIFRPILPIVLGIAFVPRRFAGTIISSVAVIFAYILALGSLAVIRPAAIASMIALGPALDWALSNRMQLRVPLYLQCAAAGFAANMIAFAVRFTAASLLVGESMGHQIATFGFSVFMSFAICGILAGLISGFIGFRE